MPLIDACEEGRADDTCDDQRGVAASARGRRTHHSVHVKREDADDGLTRCPKCASAIHASERGCNLMVCRRAHDGTP